MKDFISKQFKEPKGLVGKAAGKVMAYENGALYDWTFHKLGINNGDMVLEIGFGPGEGLNKLLSSFPKCTADGYDPSEAMVELAKEKNEDSIESGRLRIRKGTAFDVLTENQYDRIYSVNSFPMWEEKEQAIQHLHSILKNEGTISITVQPRQKEATIKEAMRLSDEISAYLKQAGFHTIKMDDKELKPCTAICVSGTK